MEQVRKDNKTVIDSPLCSIIYDKSYSASSDYMVNFGYDQVAMFMDREKRDQLNYSNFTILLKKVKPMRSILFGFDNLLAN